MKRINKKTPATASAVVFLVLLLMFTSCEKTTNPVEPKAKTGIGGLFAKSNDFYVYANLMTYTRERHYIGVDGEFVSTESVSQADFFKDGVAGAVDAGTVKHNGVALNKEAFQVSSGGSTYEYKNTTLRNQDVPLALDGSYQVWEVSGSADFESFTDSIVGPSYQVAITSPAYNSTQHKSSGITVQWTEGPNPFDSVYVSITVSTAVAHKIVPNTGSAYFSPAELTNLPTGTISVDIFDGNAVFKKLPSGKMAFFAAYSEYNVEMILED